MIFKKHLLLFIGLLNLSFFYAQTEIIPLYSEGIPCANNLTMEFEYESPGHRLLKKINTPEILYYPSQVNSKDNNRPAILVIPGGGYVTNSIDKEGIEIAKWLNDFGISAFVLKYRLPEWDSSNCKSQIALMDAQRSIRIIRSNAEEWGYNPDKIGVLGFSAGGHLASTLSVHNDNGIENSKIEIEKIGSRPDFSILIYPVITMKDPYAHSGSRESLLGKKPSKEDIKYFSPEMQVNTNTPPTILIHSTDDEVVPVENSIMYYQALIKNNIPASIHVWENGGHGYGISRAVGSVKSWTKITQEWIVQRQLIKNK